MTKHPVEYKGKTYYPTYDEGCESCAFFREGTPPAICNNFRKSIPPKGKTHACLDGDDSRFIKGIVWRTGETAKLQYITDRLTT